jgi:hypothetical protein
MKNSDVQSVAVQRRRRWQFPEGKAAAKLLIVVVNSPEILPEYQELYTIINCHHIEEYHWIFDHFNLAASVVLIKIFNMFKFASNGGRRSSPTITVHNFLKINLVMYIRSIYLSSCFICEITSPISNATVNMSGQFNYALFLSNITPTLHHVQLNFIEKNRDFVIAYTFYFKMFWMGWIFKEI